MNATIRLRLSVMFFLEYVIWGAWSPVLSAYLERIGFTGVQRGWIYALLPLGCMIAPFAGGQLADRYVSTDNVLGFEGVWVRSMPDDPDHRPIRKVKEDGSPDEHICPEGAARVAQLVHDEVQAMVGDVPAESWDWQNGDWRWDIRYDDPIGACEDGPSVAGVTLPGS